MSIPLSFIADMDKYLSGDAFYAACERIDFSDVDFGYIEDDKLSAWCRTTKTDDVCINRFIQYCKDYLTDDTENEFEDEYIGLYRYYLGLYGIKTGNGYDDRLIELCGFWSVSDDYLWMDMSEDLAQTYYDEDKANWDDDYISAKCNLSEEFIRRNVEIVDWDKISEHNMIISEAFIREFSHYINWDKIWIYRSFSEEFIRKFIDRVDWTYLSRYNQLSEEFIREFQDDIDWDEIWGCRNYSDEFTREFIDRINWTDLSGTQLSESFVEEFQDDIDWTMLCRDSTRDEEFFRKFQNKLDWWEIGAYQKLSNLGFILTFKDKLTSGYAEDNMNECMLRATGKYMLEQQGIPSSMVDSIIDML
jgi:hypothetical protein